MSIVSNAKLVEVGRVLLEQATSQRIPYIPSGMSLDGMDCQGLVEYLLIQSGVPASECNLAGSNAHWRYSLKWRGTPEEAVEKFGCVPGGAVTFIVANDGGETARGYHDALGNASHMGLKLDGSTIHASSSRGCVAESAFNDATIPNGGWNRVGLLKWVDYGTAWEAQGEQGAIQCVEESNDGDGTTELVDAGELSEQLTAGAPVIVAKHYATVVSPDGNCIKLRKTANTGEGTYWKVNPGARVLVERVKGDWSLITAICSDGHQRRAYMMSRFLRG